MARQAAQSLSPLMWIAAPLVASLLAALVLATPVRVFGLALPEPVFPLALPFAWAMIRPSVLGPVALLVGGLFLDFLWGTPLGLWAAALLIAYAFTLLAQPLLAGQATGTLVAWYVAAVALAFTAAYLFTMLGSKVVPSVTATALQFVVTALLCPASLRLIARFEDAENRYR